MVDNHNAPSRASSSSFPARPRPAVMRVLLCPVTGVCVVLLRPPSCVVVLFGSKVFSTSGGRSRGGGGKGGGGAKPSPPRFCRHPPPATFSFTGVPLSARHLFRFVCPSPAPSPPWFSFTGGTFCFCNAELTPEQKAELVMSLKVLWLLSASFPLSLLFFCCSAWCRFHWRGHLSDSVYSVLVQNKLEGLVAQHMDVLESLTPKVLKRVNLLRDIQVIQRQYHILLTRTL